MIGKGRRDRPAFIDAARGARISGRRANRQPRVQLLLCKGQQGP
jgi:hypothetical protein